jgi:hypothetical protein
VFPRRKGPQDRRQAVNFEDTHSQITADRIRREFLSAYNVAKATENLREELDRLETSLNRDDVEGQIEALSDIIVHCLGGLETFGCNTERILREIVLDNRTGLRSKRRSIRSHF